jgi:hypothetical protein
VCRGHSAPKERVVLDIVDPGSMISRGGAMGKQPYEKTYMREELCSIVTISRMVANDFSGTLYQASRPSITEFLTPFDGIDAMYRWGSRTIYTIVSDSFFDLRYIY